MTGMPQSEAEAIASLRTMVKTEELKQMESGLGLPEGFVDALYDDPSDWSLVVKLAVIVEAALGQAISTRFDSPQMDKHLDRLNINGRSGKIELASDLDLISKFAAGRLRAIAEVRNAFAHDLSVITLTFAQYADALPEEKSKKLFFDFIRNEKTRLEDVIERVPGNVLRAMFWIAGCLCLIDLWRAFKRSLDENVWRKAQILMGDALVLREKDHSAYLAKIEEAKALLKAQFPKQWDAHPSSPQQIGKV